MYKQEIINDETGVYGKLLQEQNVIYTTPICRNLSEVQNYFSSFVSQQKTPKGFNRPLSTNRTFLASSQQTSNVGSATKERTSAKVSCCGRRY